MHRLNRLTEPSTWAGLSGILLGLAEIIPAPTAQVVARGLSAVAGGLAVLLREGGSGA